MNYRQKRGAYLNCEKRMYPGVGYYEFPMMEPVDIDVRGVELVGFNYAIGCKHPEYKICHFYLDDYQFERVWNDPDRYVPILGRFKAVLAPDFSVYTDFPKAVQIFNHYRKQWCAAYWQERGINVIPTICWSTPDSFEWCFDGIPKHSLISISTVGGFGNHEDNKGAWLEGYEKCLEILDPSEILLFGKRYPEVRFDGPVYCSDNANISKRRTEHLKKQIDKGIAVEVKDAEQLRINSQAS